MSLYDVFYDKINIAIIVEEYTVLDSIPSKQEMIELVGSDLYEIWSQLCYTINQKYDMDCIWNKGGKSWAYEYKYRHSGKTLCALYAKNDCIGFMIILGKHERDKFELIRDSLTKDTQDIYDSAKTYHDGKWIMFNPLDTKMFEDFMKLLSIKRKPNRNSI